jgi:hypothetical protein
MDNQNTFFVEIENYIRNLISKNNGIFDRDSIMMQSKEWMQKFPVEFNSMLNLIENEGKNDEMMDDSAPSVAFGGSRFVDDSAPSVTFGGSRFVDDSAPSVTFGGSRFVDDSAPSVTFGGSRFVDDSAPSVTFGGSRFVDDSAPSVTFGGSRFVDDSAPSVTFGGSRFVDDSAPSVTFGGSYSSDYQKDQASSVNYSPKADSMSSDYSPCGNLDDDDCGPLQRTMSS